jgi:DNA-binding MarR family transcriptional regulator
MTSKPSPVIDHTLRSLTGYQLQRATGAAMVQYKAVFAAFGLRRTTFSCLSLIVANPGLQQGKLAAALSIERSNIVQIVEDLTRNGLITRNAAKTDRRAYALEPTAHGIDLLNRASAAVQALDTEMSSGLTQEENSVLTRALVKLERNALRIDPAFTLKSVAEAGNEETPS